MKKLFFVSLLFFVKSSFLQAQQDGTLDSTFTAAGSQYVRSVQKLANGKIICTYSSSTTGGIKVFNSDGSNSSLSFGNSITQTEFSENYIQDVVEQPDGKILFIGSNNAPKVFRFNPDGSLDNAFQNNLGSGANIKARKAIVDANGKITIIGNFTSFNGKTCGGIIRLNSDGTIDNTFVSTGTTSSEGISDIILTSNNKYILSGANIRVYNGQSTYSKTLRLNYDGTIDTSFKAPQDANFIRLGILSDGKVVGFGSNIIKILNENGSDAFIQTNIRQGNSEAKPAGVHVQRDNKVILTGIFSKIGNYNVNNIARIEINGSNIVVDTTFNANGSGPSHGILCSQLTDDGKILIGGEFYLYNGVSRDYIARLNNGTPPLNLENLVTTTGISKTTVKSALNAFPNPARDFITVEMNQEGRFSIVNLMGQEVKNGFLLSGTNQVSVENLQRGIYLLLTDQAVVKFVKE